MSSQVATSHNNSQSVSQILNSDWLKKLEPFIDSNDFTELMNRLKVEKSLGKSIYPKTSDVFKAFNLCSFDNLKVVMAAQDPYHQPNTADGLAFSCGYTKHPQPSLRYIAEEIKRTTGSEKIAENNFSLDYLAKQGVLLINSSLTVQAGMPNSHKGWWNKFMDYLFYDVINKKEHPLVYGLLGREAQDTFTKYMRFNDNAVTATHPASAAYRGSKWESEDLFNEINHQLKFHGLQEISW